MRDHMIKSNSLPIDCYPCGEKAERSYGAYRRHIVVCFAPECSRALAILHNLRNELKAKYATEPFARPPALSESSRRK